LGKKKRVSHKKKTHGEKRKENLRTLEKREIMGEKRSEGGGSFRRRTWRAFPLTKKRKKRPFPEGGKRGSPTKGVWRGELCRKDQKGKICQRSRTQQLRISEWQKWDHKISRSEGKRIRGKKNWSRGWNTLEKGEGGRRKVVAKKTVAAT